MEVYMIYIFFSLAAITFFFGFFIFVDKVKSPSKKKKRQPVKRIVSKDVSKNVSVTKEQFFLLAVYNDYYDKIRLEQDKKSILNLPGIITYATIQRNASMEFCNFLEKKFSFNQYPYYILLYVSEENKQKINDSNFATKFLEDLNTVVYTSDNLANVHEFAKRKM